jgi:hypothetical protein
MTDKPKWLVEVILSCPFWEKDQPSCPLYLEADPETQKRYGAYCWNHGIDCGSCRHPEAERVLETLTLVVKLWQRRLTFS